MATTRSRTKAGIFASVAATALLALGTALPAAAASDSGAALDPTERADLVDFWNEQGVPAATQDELLAGIDAGVLPQSVVGGASPTIETSTDELGTVTHILNFTVGGDSASTSFSPLELP